MMPSPFSRSKETLSPTAMGFVSLIPSRRIFPRILHFTMAPSNTTSYQEPVDRMTSPFMYMFYGLMPLKGFGSTPLLFQWHPDFLLHTDASLRKPTKKFEGD